MLKKHYLLGSIALFFLSGCTLLHHGKTSGEEAQQNKVTDRDIAQYVLAIDPDGKLNFIGCDGEDEGKTEWCEDSRGKDEEEVYKRNLTKYLDNIITELKASEKELLIYIHGGLNTKEKALERVTKKFKLILNDKEHPRYPIFVNWQSGPITTYTDHLWQIRQGEKEENILKKIISWPVYLFTDIGNSIVNTPKSWFVSGFHSIDSTFRPKTGADLQTEIASHKRKKVIVKIVGEEDRPRDIFRKIHWLATSPLKAVTTPFTYTMAKPAWDVMLRRTSTLFYTKQDLKIPGQIQYHSPLEREAGSGALYKFLNKLEEETTTDITLIGHSMGAIVVNDIVHLKPNLPYKNIVYMASADSIENFLNKVVPHLYCSPGKEQEAICGNKINFYSLYLHPDNENREVSWGGTIPSGSLLTWIDGMYTTPKTVLDKRSGRWDNMTRAITLIPEEVRENMHFTIFGIQENKECTEEEGLNCTAQKHGDFGDLPFWREEVWKGEHLSAQKK